MSLNKKEYITYDDEGFSVRSLDFNNLIYINWSEVEWKPKNIEKYVLYVLETTDSKKNIFDGEKPLYLQVVTKPYALVKISNVNLAKRLNGYNIGFFVGAIEKGKSEPSWKPSSWKQAKIKFTMSPNIWTNYVDGVDVERVSVCSLSDFLANYKRSVKPGSVKDFIKEKNVAWGFWGEMPEKRMTLDEVAAKFAECDVYTSEKKTDILLPKTMRELIDSLIKYQKRPKDQSSPKKGVDDKIDISKYIFLKALKNIPSIKRFKNNEIALIEFIFWKQIKFYRPKICKILQISWDGGCGPFSVECYDSDPPREVYKGSGKTCIDKYFDWNIYGIRGRQWYASFCASSDGEPYPFYIIGIDAPQVVLK